MLFAIAQAIPIFDQCYSVDAKVYFYQSLSLFRSLFISDSNNKDSDNSGNNNFNRQSSLVSTRWPTREQTEKTRRHRMKANGLENDIPAMSTNQPATIGDLASSLFY